MKKLVIVLACLLFLNFNVYADKIDVKDDIEMDVIKTLEIMIGDENGNLNLDKNVTRAEFAKMATYASRYKNNVATNSMLSLYSDLKSNHWATPYVKIGVDNKWFNGYVDGTFRPNNSIKYEEGMTVVLRMLGYTSDKLKGVYPNAQLIKGEELGLGKNMNAKRGTILTRNQCKTLFYNLLTTKNIDGQVYGSLLEVPIKNDKVDYLSLIFRGLKGGFVAKNGLDVPFESGIIYKNGSIVDKLDKYDVYYYNEGLKKIFAYDKKEDGKIQEILPNDINPEIIKVNDKQYKLDSFKSKYMFSSFGSYKKGDEVRLLLGIDDKVVSAIKDFDVFNEYYGVVTSRKRVSKDVDDKTLFKIELEVQCSDGEKRVFSTDKTYAEAGDFVNVVVDNDDTKVIKIYTKNLSGKVVGGSIDGRSFSDDINIIEVFGSKVAKIKADELNGAVLKSEDVQYYSTDELGNINNLILKNVTGNLMTYGYAYAGSSSSDNMYDVNASYDYLVDGVSKNVSLYNGSFSVKNGGVVEVKSLSGDDIIRELKHTEIIDIGKDFINSYIGKIMLSDKLQTYLKTGDEYDLVNIKGLDLDEYKLTAYYSENVMGKKVRVVLAQKK